MINMLAAIDEQRGLASQGQIPWHIPTDTKHYRELMASQGGNILVGKTTYEQMGELLSNLNVYLVSKDTKIIPGVTMVNNLDTFLENYREELWIIGGASIFNSAIKYADKLYLTEIEGRYNCDIFFPEYKNEFKLVEKEGPFTENGFNFNFVNYSR